MEQESVLNETEKNKKSSIVINVLIIIFILVICLLMYAKYVGTKGIRVHEYKIASNNIPINFSGIKIIYFSDFLYNGKEDIEMIEEAVKKINELKPDIVLFGGGLINDGYKINDQEKEKFQQELQKINATLGKYAVLSNTDKDPVNTILENSGYNLLENKMEKIYNKDLTPICLVGISSYILGSYNITDSFKYLSDETCYTISFTHEADIIDKILALPNKPNLFLAGNSLGGEINIPFYGGLFRREGNTKYYEEYYDINGIQIYISSGFGVNETGMRFNNKPSFNFFRLKSSSKK